MTQNATTIQHASWVSILAAFLYEDFGAKTIVLGLVLLPLGWIGLGLINVGISHDNTVGMGSVVAITGQGACIAYTSISYSVAVLFLVDLFPSVRSRVLGLLACTYNIFLLLYHATFSLLDLSLSHFYVLSIQFLVAGGTLVLMALATAAFCVVPMTETPELQLQKDRRIFNKLSLLCFCILWLVVASQVCTDNIPGKAILVIVGWMSPVCYLAGIYFDGKIPVEINFQEANETGPVREETVTLFKAMKRNSFWLIFFTTAVIVGSGTALRNNLFDIMKYAKVAVKLEPDVYYQLMAVMEAFAGLLSGLLAERIQPRYMLCCLCFLCSTAMFMLYMGLRFSFLCGVIFTGLSLGALQTLLPVMIYAEFGRAQFSRKYGFMFLAYSTGALILSTAISSQAYFVHIGGDRARSCEGDGCFSISFAINCAASCLAAVAMLMLAQTKSVYLRVETQAEN